MTAPVKARAGVEADAHAAGRAVVAEPAVVGHEVVGRVLGRHAALDGEAVVRTASWLRRPISGSESGLPWAMRICALDDVEAGHLLGDGVLDLDARVDLDEVELARVGDRRGTRPCRRCRSRTARPTASAASQMPLPDRRVEVRRGAISTTF